MFPQIGEGIVDHLYSVSFAFISSRDTDLRIFGLPGPSCFLNLHWLLLLIVVHFGFDWGLLLLLLLKRMMARCGSFGSWNGYDSFSDSNSTVARFGSARRVVLVRQCACAVVAPNKTSACNSWTEAPAAVAVGAANAVLYVPVAAAAAGQLFPAPSGVPPPKLKITRIDNNAPSPEFTLTGYRATIDGRFSLPLR